MDDDSIKKLSNKQCKIRVEQFNKFETDTQEIQNFNLCLMIIKIDMLKLLTMKRTWMS